MPVVILRKALDVDDKTMQATNISSLISDLNMASDAKSLSLCAFPSKKDIVAVYFTIHWVSSISVLAP